MGIKNSPNLPFPRKRESIILPLPEDAVCSYMSTGVPYGRYQSEVISEWGEMDSCFRRNDEKVKANIFSAGGVEGPAREPSFVVPAYERESTALLLYV